ncbi:MAG: hypothetical protein WCK81_10325 [Betaproteobacteria bacterium]
MFKNTLIAALLATTGLVALAQTTTAAPKAPSASAALPATPAKAAAVAAPAAPAAKAVAAEAAVKKSKNNICHDKTSPGYKQTKNFTEFQTMEECVKSGGRPNKASK